MTLLFIINYQDKFFTLVSRHRDVFLNQNQELLKGKVLKGSFYATQDNMGIVSILFNSHNHIVYDTVRFRIKEKNSKQWYYESDYNTAAFFGLPLYPLGFPKINNSQGKEYYFELESISGTSTNYVSISTRYPQLESKYVFSHESIQEDKQRLTVYTIKKLFNLIQDRNVLFTFFVNLIPLIFYILFIYIDSEIHFYRYIKHSKYKDVFLKLIQRISSGLHEKMNQKRKQIKNKRPLYLYEILLPFLTYMLILWDIFFITKIIGIIVSILSVMSVIVFNTLSISYKITLVIVLVLLAILPFAILFEMEMVAQKLGMWAYIMLALMVIIYFSNVFDKSMNETKTS